MIVPPRNMYKFLEDHRMYVLDKSGHLDLEASAKAADELQALWAAVRRETLEEAANEARSGNNGHDPSDKIASAILRRIG